ncbi:MAG: CAP domain-containing protein [Planctomycetes bacterium]|nr:CAP domain-containing protein [Planctomycetota bacterium]
MRFLHLLAALAVLLVPALRAQDDESQFNRSQAERLNKFAKNAFDKGFPRQARLIWLQSIKLYDQDDAVAHKAIGNVKVGASWAPDPTFKYPTADTGTGADGSALFKAYEQLKKDLAGGHRRQAQTWARAGRKDRSEHHYQMVLRWVKDDAEAQKALEHHEIGGVTGTDLEQTLYDRSKAIERAVNEQSSVEYPVETVQAPNEALDVAQVKYVSVKSEHFLLHGDPEQEPFLKQALAWAERTARVTQVAFPWEARIGGEFAYFTSKDTYRQILKANAHQVPDLQWKLEHTSTSAVGTLAIGATESTQILFDAVVRNVAQGHAQFRSDALSEGIGHTFVGMMFNNNRLFAVDLKKQEGTTASEEDREYTSPNFDIWKTLALEMAWKMTGGVPALDLAWCEAATLTNEQRIKSWSFCDYVMRRDPEILRKFDRMILDAKQKKQKQPIEFAENFTKETGVSLVQLDKEWEDFWTEATPVLQAIRNNTPPLMAISKGVEKWLAAFNEARAANHAAPVTWSSQLSTRCYEHANYLKANKGERGVVAEHRQLAELGGNHLGNMFAQMAIVDVDANPANAKKMFERWMLIPGYRDTLVHDFLRSVGIFSEGNVLVMDVVAGLGRPKSKSSGYLCHPWKDATGIPDKVEVALIGPELEALLEKHGRGKQKVVGYPFTIHFGSMVLGDRLSYRCVAQDAKGEKIEGAILMESSTNRRASAPGMVTFYPFDPLPRGQIAVAWSWEVDGQAQSLQTRFATK